MPVIQILTAAKELLDLLPQSAASFHGLREGSTVMVGISPRDRLIIIRPAGLDRFTAKAVEAVFSFCEAAGNLAQPGIVRQDRPWLE